MELNQTHSKPNLIFFSKIEPKPNLSKIFCTSLSGVAVCCAVLFLTTVSVPTDSIDTIVVILYHDKAVKCG